MLVNSAILHLFLCTVVLYSTYTMYQGRYCYVQYVAGTDSVVFVKENGAQVVEFRNLAEPGLSLFMTQLSPSDHTT